MVADFELLWIAIETEFLRFFTDFPIPTLKIVNGIEAAHLSRFHGPDSSPVPAEAAGTAPRRKARWEYRLKSLFLH